MLIVPLILSPVRFHFTYVKRGVDDYLRLDMLLFPFLRWYKEVPLIRPRPEGPAVVAQFEGRDAKSRGEVEESKARWDISAIFSSFNSLRQRLGNYGLGVTLASFFIPDKYLKYIRVINELENCGIFTSFQWRTLAGRQNPAHAAWLVGGLWALKGEVLGLLQSRYRFRCRPAIAVQPAFGRNVLDTEVDCIFQVKLRQIMLTGLKEYLRRLFTSGRREKR